MNIFSKSHLTHNTIINITIVTMKLSCITADRDLRLNLKKVNASLSFISRVIW